PGRSAFDFIAFLPHAIPNIVFSVGVLLFVLYAVQRIVSLYGTLWLLVFLLVIARLSYATRMTNGTLLQVHRDLEEAATVSGGVSGHVVRSVLVPLLTL